MVVTIVNVHEKPEKKEDLVLIGCDFSTLDLYSLNLKTVLDAAEKRFPGKTIWVRDGMEAVGDSLARLPAFFREGAASCSSVLEVNPLRIECVELRLPVVHQR